jgi:hypothetical protein
MMRYALMALLLALPLAGRAAAEEVSADIVDGAGAAIGRLQLAGDKARIESRDFPDGYFLVDGAARAAWFVKPAERRFMAARQSSRLTRLFVPLAPDDPCAGWQAMAQASGAAAPGGRWRCDALGGERIEGLDTVEYRVAPPGQAPFYGWVAPPLGIALRLETGDGAVFALAHIVRAPLPAALFAIPPDFARFDPLRLIERLKQSDVWVEPPQ